MTSEVRMLVKIRIATLVQVRRASGFLLIMATAVGLAGEPARAVVDMKNASFVDVWTDIIVPKRGFDLRVRRGYKSRSDFNGLFGFGWCSDFETSLVVTDWGSLLLKECGAGLELFYKSSSTLNRTQMRAANEEAVQQVAASRRSITEQDLERLRKDFERSLNNIDLRFHLISKHNIHTTWRPPLQVIEKYVAKGREKSEVIEFDGRYFVRNLNDGTQQRFDQAGRLIFMTDNEDRFVNFSYVNGILRQVRDDQGRSFEFEIDQASGRVLEIRAPHGLRATYRYEGENLVEVRNAWQHTYTYKYDEDHNLTNIGFPDRTNKAITYDKDRDWVTSFKSRNDCLETYKYKPQADDPKNHYTSHAIKRCKTKVVTDAQYEFWHGVRADGQNYLRRVWSSSGKDVSDFLYHPYLGSVSSVSLNGEVTSYEYHRDGSQKRRRKAEGYREYRAFSSRGEIAAVFDWSGTSSDGNSASGSMSVYGYNRANNLITAHSSNGLSLEFGYDSIGRMAWISDAANRTMLIGYTGNYGKPDRVEVDGIGTVSITYNESGKIDKVTSEAGETVAGAVTRLFNEFLDVIGPANDRWFTED